MMRDGIPPEYWETCDSRQGGFVVDINENGLYVRSPVNMYIGGELRIRVLFSLGYEFDGFQALARIIGKDLCSEGGWEAYEYELEFIRISEQDRLKLRNLLGIRHGKNIYS
jgi:hypothetical protein